MNPLDYQDRTSLPTRRVRLGARLICDPTAAAERRYEIVLTEDGVDVADDYYAETLDAAITAAATLLAEDARGDAYEIRKILARSIRVTVR